MLNDDLLELLLGLKDDSDYLHALVTSLDNGHVGDSEFVALSLDRSFYRLL